MVVIGRVCDAVRARAQRAGNCALWPVMLVGNKHPLYWSRWPLQILHHSEVLSTLSHIEVWEVLMMGNVVLLIDLLGRRWLAILTLIALFSNYSCVLLQWRTQDGVMTDRWSLILIKVLSPITPINWLFPQCRRNRWDKLTQHISTRVLCESTPSLYPCKLSNPISILTMIQSLCSQKILQFVPFRRS